MRHSFFHQLLTAKWRRPLHVSMKECRCSDLLHHASRRREQSKDILAQITHILIRGGEGAWYVIGVQGIAAAERRLITEV